MSKREHQCPECGYQTTRDHAAAQVIKLRGESNVVPVDDGEWKLSAECVLTGIEISSQVERRNVSMRVESDQLTA